MYALFVTGFMNCIHVQNYTVVFLQEPPFIIVWIASSKMSTSQLLRDDAHRDLRWPHNSLHIITIKKAGPSLPGLCPDVPFPGPSLPGHKAQGAGPGRQWGPGAQGLGLGGRRQE